MRIPKILVGSVAGLSALSKKQHDGEVRNLEIKWVGCNEEQKSVYSPAIVGAYDCINTVNKLRRDDDNAEEKSLRTQWFGEDANQQDHEYVTDVFSKLSANQGNEPFLCSHDDDDTCSLPYVPAYTIHDQVVFCNNMRLVGEQLGEAEMVRVVIHELSHASFNGVSRDIDYEGHPCYGEECALDMARDSPSDAAHNADNLSFYAKAFCAANKEGSLRSAEDIEIYRRTGRAIASEANSTASVA